MKPRITISEDPEGNLDIWLNEAGRDQLVRELQSLSKDWDHINLMAHEWWNGAEIDLSLRPYRPADKVIGAGKIYFRADESDRVHYPHVLDEGE